MMTVDIYQIDMDRDNERVCFMSLDSLPNRQNPTEIDSSIYDAVYHGDVEANNLEDVYRIFNLEHPENYRGRSLSVSDVVVVSAEDGEQKAYYCDSFGFKEVKFNMEMAKEMQKDTMKVVLLEPGKMAKVVEMGTSLEAMQQAVGGMIEAYYPFAEEVCIVCNEEGKINGMPLNRAVYAEPEQMDLSYAQLKNEFRMAEREGHHMSAYIVFSQESFDQEYPEESRTYEVSSNNKAFQPNMGGYSIYGSSLDGTDRMVRLEQYMAAELGGDQGWKIERCYIEEPNREMIDIIAGPCFICDCSGENFASLSKEQLDHYQQEFKYPEQFFRVDSEIKAVPYTPEKNQER